MISLIVLLVATFLGRAVSLFTANLDTWLEATRLGLVVMFVFTGGSHFTSLRADFIRMVPPVLPRPGLLVSLTGVLEMLGGLALLTPLRCQAASGRDTLEDSLHLRDAHALSAQTVIFLCPTSIGDEERRA